MKKIILLVGIILVLAACSKGEPQVNMEELPPGDAVRGAELFTKGANGAAACSSCHQLEADGSAPRMDGYSERAGERVKDQSASEYTYLSIVRPARHLVTGFSNIMPNDYEEKFTPQQIADLIAYLLTL